MGAGVRGSTRERVRRQIAMSRGQHKFKQSDVTKAVNAMVKAGIAIGRVEIDADGKIVIIPARPEDAANREQPEKNEWDEALQ
jgi:hypothetical protein